MYARVIQVPIKPGAMDDALNIFESVAQEAAQQSGFVDFMVLADRTNNAMVVVSLWASEADAIARDSSGFAQQQIAKFGELVTGPPDIRILEVARRA